MAHVAKYSASATGHMTAHYERRQVPVTDKNGNVTMEYIRFGNQDIDTSKSHLNYNLAPMHENGQVDFIRTRTTEARTMKRDDVKVMCSWVVTLPKVHWHDENVHMTPNMEVVERLFFERTYKFMADRYGEQNIISAYVHKDESTPHMHFAFVPVTEDKKRGGEKVSAKEVLTKNDLQTFHYDLERHLDSFHDWKFEILNEVTKEGNKSITELKRGTAIEEVAKVREKADKDIQQIHREVEHERELASITKSSLKADIDVLERKKEGLLTSLEVEELKGSKTILGGLKGVSYAEFEALKRTAATVDQAVKRAEMAEKRADTADERAMERVQKYIDSANEQLQDKVNEVNTQLKEKEKALYLEYSEKTNKVEWRNDRLERENQKLKNEVGRLNEVVDYLKSMIKQRIPELVETMEKRVSKMMSRTQGRGYGE